MQNVNWWLMALSFLLGLVLTLFLVIRRVKREVPEYGSLGAGAPAAAAGAAGVAGAAKLKGGAGVAEDEPYGAGSIRVKATVDAPGGYPVKGNEDSMLYHTTDSPSWKQTIAEIWFRDTDSAERAGFLRWDSGGAGEAAGAAAAGAAGVAGAAKLKGDASVVGDEPYGAGSIRVKATADAPSGYPVKGNEDSMLYHTTESPSYERTIAEVWFRDVETAEAAGFNRWDSGKSQRGQK
jgi:hypothetical protein